MHVSGLVTKLRQFPKHAIRQPVAGAWSWRIDLPLALLALLAGLATRLHGLGGKPYWLDEVTTLRRASLGTVDLVVDSLSFHHLPLYFLISRAFLPLGTDEASLRLPAALFGALSCGLLFGLARMLGGRRAGLTAAMLLAFNPFQVQYGQEARSYTLVISFIVVALWAVCRVLRDPGCRARTAWLVYGLSTLAALDTLSVALFWLLAALLAIVLAAARDPIHRRLLLRRAAIVNTAVLVCYIPWIVAMYHLTRGDMASGLDWVPPLSASRVWTTLQAVYLLRTTSLIRFHTFPGGLPWLGLVVAGAAGAGLVTHVRRDAAVRAAAVALLTLPLGMLTVSLFAPVWMPRYLAWGGPVFFLFAGLGVAQLPPRLGWTGLALLCAGCVVNLLPYYRLETKPLWDRAALLLSSGLSPQDLLLTDNVAEINMMNVDLQRLGKPIPRQLWTVDPAVAVRHLEGGHAVWAVHGRVGQADHNRLAMFDTMLAQLGTPCWSGKVGLDITIRAYAPQGGSCPATSLP